MPLESASFVSQLDPTNPLGTDPIAFVDEHLRLIKQAIKGSFPNISGALQATVDTLDYAASNPFPKGGIVMWSGAVANIPKGWLICDGTQGTPDLRDRFVVGAGTSYKVGDSGGSKDAWLQAHTHTATSGNADATHTHSVTGSTDAVADHFHFTMVNGEGTNYNGVGKDDTVTSSNHANSGNWQYHTSSGVTAQANVGKSNLAGGHSHAITIAASQSGDAHKHPITVASAGADGAGKNLPPYLALAYIMKT